MMHSDEHSAALLQAAQHTMLAGLALSENGASCDLRERTVVLKARASKPRPRHVFMSMSTSQVKLILSTQIPNSPPIGWGLGVFIGLRVAVAVAVAVLSCVKIENSPDISELV